MYLKKKTRDLDREVQISNTETDKRATAASKAPKELDISKTEANELSGMVTELQRRLQRLEGLGAPEATGCLWSHTYDFMKQAHPKINFG